MLPKAKHREQAKLFYLHSLYDLNMGIKVSGFSACLLLCCLLASPAYAITRFHNFVIRKTQVTRLCHNKEILTVNGQFPGPTIYAQKGDVVIVHVYNQADRNVTLHWHGVDQPRNSWSDGPEFITQCPIQPGTKFTYRVKLSWEEGTLWWHAHNDFARSTLFGAIVIHPKPGFTFPYPAPDKEITVVLAEWWIGDVNQMLKKMLANGGDMSVSDAFIINGQPGDTYNCSKEDMFTALVEPGKRYLLRVVQAALNSETFFAIAGHNLTVVGTDGSYTKPYTTSYLHLSPGQTVDVLLEANQPAGANSRYYMALRGYMGNPTLSMSKSTATGVLQYIPTPAWDANQTAPPPPPPPEFPDIPLTNDTAAATAFQLGLRSLASESHPVDVPQTVDEQMLITVSTQAAPCESCNALPVPGARIAASLNNLSFVYPVTDILSAYYWNISGVYGTNFPNEPPVYFDFTGENLPPTYLMTKQATEVKVFEFNTTVEMVFQGTNINNGADNHPMHTHGYSFYVVGMGFGNWDKNRDPPNYNLVDPPLQNTVGLPTNGWVAIRLRLTNPGVWFFHCHIDRHSIWGMNGVMIVKDGPTRQTSLAKPPRYRPPC